MKKYFDSEMNSLKVAAKAFASAYPEHASQLNMDSLEDGDPYIERLLEGTAFLTAQIKQHIDNDVPEFSEVLLSELYPQAMRPYPSMVVAEFNAKLPVEETCCIEQGTRLTYQANSLSDCHFTTVAPLHYHHLTVNDIDVSLNKSGGTRCMLRGTFGIPKKLSSLNHLRLYINANDALASELHCAFMAKKSRVSLRATHGESAAHVVGSVKLSFANGSKSMLPTEYNEEAAYSLLRDYFQFREKYFFFDIEFSASEQMCRDFELVFDWDYRFDRDEGWSTELFKFNCVPAINLFLHDCEPVRVDGKKAEYRLSIDTREADCKTLYRLEHVNGSMTHSKNKLTAYQRLGLCQLGVKSLALYQLSTHSAVDTLHYLRLSGRLSSEEQTLHCNALVSNGHYPRQHLNTAMLSLHRDDAKLTLRATNLTRPSPYYARADKRQSRWALMSQLALSQQSVLQLSVFKALLSSHDLSGLSVKKNEALLKLSLATEQAFERGALVRFKVYLLQLDETCFYSLAECYVYCHIIFLFLSSFSDINYAVRLTVSGKQEQELFSWQSTITT